MSLQFLVTLATLAALCLGFHLMRSWLGGSSLVHWRRVVRIVLFLAAGLAMLDFSRPWLYPVLIGLAFGSLLPAGLPRE